jgi:hypothetical protein
VTYEEAQDWWVKHSNGRIEFCTRLREDWDPKNDKGDGDFDWGWDATGFLSETQMVTAWEPTFMEAVERIKELFALKIKKKKAKK